MIREEIEDAFPEDRLSHTQISDKYKELRSLYQNFLALLELPDLEYDEETGKIDAPDARWSFIRLKGGHKCEQDLRERGFSPARLQLFRSAFPYEQGNSLMVMCSWDSDDDHLLKEIFKKKKRAPQGQKKGGAETGGEEEASHQTRIKSKSHESVLGEVEAIYSPGSNARRRGEDAVCSARVYTGQV